METRQLLPVKQAGSLPLEYLDQALRLASARVSVRSWLCSSIIPLTVEPGGDALFRGGVLQHIARQLLDGKLVEGHIPVEGVDDPVPVGPDGVVPERRSRIAF